MCGDSSDSSTPPESGRATRPATPADGTGTPPGTARGSRRPCPRGSSTRVRGRAGFPLWQQLPTHRADGRGRAPADCRVRRPPRRRGFRSGPRASRAAAHAGPRRAEDARSRAGTRCSSSLFQPWNRELVVSTPITRAPCSTNQSSSRSLLHPALTAASSTGAGRLSKSAVSAPSPTDSKSARDASKRLVRMSQAMTRATRGSCVAARITRHPPREKPARVTCRGPPETVTAVWWCCEIERRAGSRCFAEPRSRCRPRRGR